VSGRERFKRYLMKEYELTEEEADGMVEYLEEQEREASKHFGKRAHFDPNNPDNWALLLSIGFGVLSAFSFIKWLFSLGHSSARKRKTEKEKEWGEVYF